MRGTLCYKAVNGKAAYPQPVSERRCGSWALLPPHIPKEEVQPAGCKNLEAIEWFDRVLPQLRHKYGTGPDAELLEGIQEAGETIFVPPKWWHAVLNLDFTVAVPSSASRCSLSGLLQVTQNFTSSANFVESWIKTQKGRPKLSCRWYERLVEHRPDLAALADANRLAYNPVERKQEKKRQRVLQREKKREKKRLKKEEYNAKLRLEYQEKVAAAAYEETQAVVVEEETRQAHSI